MTDAIQVLRAVMPGALRSQRPWRRAVDALRHSLSGLAARRRLNTLSVSEAWLREHEAASSKRQDADY
jgi:hypothetical protein